MPLRIELSDEAEPDLREIWAYIAERNEPAADRLLMRILEVLQELAEQPEMGSAMPELGDGVRRFVATPAFGVFYAQAGPVLRLLRVMRLSRNITDDAFE